MTCTAAATQADADVSEAKIRQEKDIVRSLLAQVLFSELWLLQVEFTDLT